MFFNLAHENYTLVEHYLLFYKELFVNLRSN